jgi:hypothetical protein
MSNLFALLRFQVFTAVTMKNAVFWDVTLCRSCVSRHFGGTCSLQPPTQRWFLARGFFYPEDGGDTFLRNVCSHKIYTAPHLRRRHSSCLHLFCKGGAAYKSLEISGLDELTLKANVPLFFLRMIVNQLPKNSISCRS